MQLKRMTTMTEADWVLFHLTSKLFSSKELAGNLSLSIVVSQGGARLESISE
jgi:hypothetical protein